MPTEPFRTTENRPAPIDSSMDFMKARPELGTKPGWIVNPEDARNLAEVENPGRNKALRRESRLEYLHNHKKTPEQNAFADAMDQLGEKYKFALKEVYDDEERRVLMLNNSKAKEDSQNTPGTIKFGWSALHATVLFTENGPFTMNVNGEAMPLSLNVTPLGDLSDAVARGEEPEAQLKSGVNRRCENIETSGEYMVHFRRIDLSNAKTKQELSELLNATNEELKAKAPPESTPPKPSDYLEL